MILKNKKDIERTFKELLKIEINDNKYIVYQDINTLNIYSGRIEGNYLKPLNDNEFEYINKVLDKVGK